MLVATLAVTHRHRFDPVAHDIGPNRFMLQKNEKSSRRGMGGQHSREDRQRDVRVRGRAGKLRPGPG